MYSIERSWWLNFKIERKSGKFWVKNREKNKIENFTSFWGGVAEFWLVDAYLKKEFLYIKSKNSLKIQKIVKNIKIPNIIKNSKNCKKIQKIIRKNKKFNKNSKINKIKNSNSPLSPIIELLSLFLTPTATISLNLLRNPLSIASSF